MSRQRKLDQKKKQRRLDSAAKVAKRRKAIRDNRALERELDKLRDQSSDRIAPIRNNYDNQ